MSDAMPRRVQLSRRKGYRKPAGAIVVSRPTRWGNPFAVARDADTDARRRLVGDYRSFLERGLGAVTVADVRGQLRGKDLACWCPLGQPCHADVLLEIANR